jgi:hypothetical protein
VELSGERERGLYHFKLEGFWGNIKAGIAEFLSSTLINLVAWLGTAGDKRMDGRILTEAKWGIKAI